MKFIEIKHLFIIVIILNFSCSTDDIADDGYESLYEEGEEFLTAHLSVRTTSNNAFGKEIPGLSFEDKLAFTSGNALFTSVWTPVDIVNNNNSTTDGLGPTFNAVNCAGCHVKDGRGKPHVNGENSNGFLMRLSTSNNPNTGPVAHANYGKQIQDRAINNVSYEGKINVTYTNLNRNYPDGTPYVLRKPNYTIIDKQFGELSDIKMSPRVGQQVIGLGLIDAITRESIEANIDIGDSNNDGIIGKANYIIDELSGELKIGKFGWKANQPTLRQQVADAFNGDMGLSTSIFSEQNCPDSQTLCNESQIGGEPEVTNSQLNDVIFYQSALAVPKRRNFMDQNVLEGKVLFREADCIKCHATNFTTGDSSENNYVEGVLIHPFSDFLLHDMGQDLADYRSDYLANGSEWRTQPLWGIGLISTVNNHTNFLHDGRARNIEEAILWHGGEADKSKIKFMNLNAIDRNKLIEYVNSL